MTSVASPQITPNPLSSVAAANQEQSAVRKRRQRSLGSRSWSKFKKLAWRSTAMYFWVTFGLFLLGQHETVTSFWNDVAEMSTRTLADFGFVSSQRDYFLPVVKATWLITICALSPIQAVGFCAYVIFAPIIAMVLFIGRYLPDIDPKIQSDSDERLRPRMLSSGVLATGAWFLLFGDTSSAPALFAGVMFVGLVWLIIFARAFQLAKPVTEAEAAILGNLEIGAMQMMVFAGSQKALTKSSLVVTRPTVRAARSLYRRAAIMTRGRRGQQRVSMFILAEYAFFIFALGSITTLFWALAAKYALAPSTISYSDALTFAAAHIPGVPALLRLRSPSRHGCISALESRFS